MYVCAPLVGLVPWMTERLPGPLRLELQTVVRHHMGTRNQTGVLWKYTMLLMAEPPLQTHYIGFCLFLFFFFVFLDRVSLCHPSWPRIHYPPASASWMLELQATPLHPPHDNYEWATWNCFFFPCMALTSVCTDTRGHGLWAIQFWSVYICVLLSALTMVLWFLCVLWCLWLKKLPVCPSRQSVSPVNAQWSLLSTSAGMWPNI